ncbi:LacI family DNA-binding transcriptional regulator [Nesterenkonia alba]|uniref:LacI family DNA-binding transcriptional regulator n=1 Tax=Nesterenkonia alba TaxID=515814 RepID=UPI0003FC5C60|nr:LacI family DNA-binding transcriptional regulator [Nesterenkonia alba]
MLRTVTMSDVARAAGVSPMTVSNVVNGRPGVSEAVRRRVLEQIEATGYRMNAAARQLRSGRSGVIGLAVPELDRPYFGALGSHITRVAKDAGYRIAVEETGAGEAGEIDAIQLSQSLQYDGLILSSVNMDLRKIGGVQSFPIVLLGERDNPTGADHIALPNVEGARAVTRHLAERGARRIAYVGGPSTEAVSIFSLRREGFEAGLADAGLEVPRGGEDPLRFETQLITMEEGRRAGWQIAESPQLPDAVFAITDTVALGVVRGLADRGVRVPEDLLVAGFDDVPESEYLVPSLTTVAPDHEWTARRAVELLLARMEKPSRTGNEERAPFTVAIRESTGG